MKQQANYGSHRQRGIALPIIMIILVLAALVTIYTTTTSVKEQQVTADQYRSEQAFSTAQAGVEHAVNTHNDYTAVYDDVSENYLPSGGTLEDSFDKGSYTVMFCDIWDDDGDEAKSVELMADFLTDTLVCTNSIHPTYTNSTDSNGFKGDKRVGILSVGKPDDASGRRTISVVSEPGLKVGGGPPGPPFTARGGAGLSGNVKLINRYANLTMWLGDDLDFSSAATETFINSGELERNDYGPAGDAGDRAYRLAMIDPETGATQAQNTAHFVIQASNSSIGQNSDALTDDANLTNLASEDMFERVFHSDIDTVRTMAQEAGVYYTDIDEIEDHQTGLIWWAPSGSVTLNKYLGTIDAPVFLVVEFPDPAADVLTIQGGNTMTDLEKMNFGQFFIFGNLNQNGSPVIVGSLMLAEHAPKVTGGGTIVYDPESAATSPEGPAGLRGIKPGTWKDWGYVN